MHNVIHMTDGDYERMKDALGPEWEWHDDVRIQVSERDPHIALEETRRIMHSKLSPQRQRELIVEMLDNYFGDVMPPVGTLADAEPESEETEPAAGDVDVSSDGNHD